jgi:hypothetical protein
MISILFKLLFVRANGIIQMTDKVIKTGRAALLRRLRVPIGHPRWRRSSDALPDCL